MTQQEIFNRAYVGVIKQGRICVDATGNCTYYDHTDGARCAWGHVLTEEQAKESPAGLCCGGAEDYNKSLGFTDADLRFGYTLQRAHDCSESVAAFRETMKQIAGTYNLTIPTIE